MRRARSRNARARLRAPPYRAAPPPHPPPAPRYGTFAATLQQSRAAISSATGTSLQGFAFPTRDGGAAGAGAGAGAGGAPAEDDLYS